MITHATTSDIPQLVQLLSLLFAQEAEFRPDPRVQGEGLRLIVESPDIGTILVLWDQTRIVAMVNLLYTVSTALGGRVVVLEDMIVSPPYRGRGCGTRLLTAAIEHARAIGARRITLLTDTDNADAQRFYQRAGFRASEMVAMRWHDHEHALSRA